MWVEDKNVDTKGVSESPSDSSSENNNSDE
jgi:hypothetical protein